MIWGLVLLKDYKAHMHFQMFKEIDTFIQQLNLSKVAENTFLLLQKKSISYKSC